jgi:hypothetical protein
LFSFDWKNSWLSYVEMAKFVVLFFLLMTAVQTENDFLWLMMFCFACGLFYWGLEAKFGKIQIIRGRLEGFEGAWL